MASVQDRHPDRAGANGKPPPILNHTLKSRLALPSLRDGLQPSDQTHPHSVITVMADKPNMMEITSFDKTKLKKTQTQEKNPLPTKEAIEQERRESSS
ncbi:thymosin beta [Clarias gariepinus]